MKGVESLCCCWLSKWQPKGESMETNLRGASDSDCTPHLARVQEKLHELERQVGVDKAALAPQEEKVRVEQKG